MLAVICIALILVCAFVCVARIWEKKKMDFISGICAAACAGAVIGLVVYKIL